MNAIFKYYSYHEQNKSLSCVVLAGAIRTKLNEKFNDISIFDDVFLPFCTEFA